MAWLRDAFVRATDAAFWAAVGLAVLGLWVVLMVALCGPAAAQLPTQVVDEYCPTEPANQYNLTPTCLDDKLLWDAVPDADLDHYRVYKIISEQEIEIALVPAGTEILFMGCVADSAPAGYCVRAADTSGQLSVNCSNPVTWNPGLDWDCVSETRAECDPSAPCAFVCDRWDTCVLDGTAYRCCRMGRLEPVGCVQCGPPIGGSDAWTGIP